MTVAKILTELTELRNLDALSWLQEWYLQHCNGVWEHSCGVTIQSLDNPGWRIVIDLKETELAGKDFESFFVKHSFEDRSETDWIHFKVKDQKFEMGCGPKNLEEALQIFRAFATT